MEIKNVTSVGEVQAGAKQAPSAPPLRTPADRISTVDASRMSDMARAEQVRAGTMRTVRIAHIEDAIRSGSYEPSASRVASRMLDAAEIDAKLKSVLAR